MSESEKIKLGEFKSEFPELKKTLEHIRRSL
jgi:hypothetical protein